jgi:hypothetical protein
MDSKLVRHVGNLILIVRCIGQNLQGAGLSSLGVGWWTCVTRLREATFENLHDTVGIGMTVALQLKSLYHFVRLFERRNRPFCKHELNQFDGSWLRWRICRYQWVPKIYQ